MKIKYLKCKKGYIVGSQTGAKECPACEYKENNNSKCITAQAAAGAMGYFKRK